MAKAKVKNIELNYKATGTGFPVVLIHGHPFDHTMWQPQIDALSNAYRVITPDLRGYGGSSLPASSSSRFEDYATDVLELLDYLQVNEYHLGGLSMGGQVIMEMYRQAPHRIRSLIFADTFAGPDTQEVKQGRYDAADRLEKEGMNIYADEVIYKMIMPAHVNSMPAVADHVIKMMKATSPVAAATALRARCERINYLTEVLPHIDIPTLVIVGRNDEFTLLIKPGKLKIVYKSANWRLLKMPATCLTWSNLTSLIRF